MVVSMGFEDKVKDKVKVKSWFKTLPKLLDGCKMPDPYLIDKKGYNAFDTLSMYPLLLNEKFKRGDLKGVRLLNLCNNLAKVQKSFLQQEIERVTLKEFQPRFTEQLEQDLQEDLNRKVQSIALT